MTATYASPETMRNGDLQQIAELLKSQRARAVDFVASAGALTAQGGRLVIAGTEPVITDDGVTTADGVYAMTSTAEAQLADTLSIPVAYMRRMRGTALDLWDANVTGWLHGHHPVDDPWAAAERAGDTRKFLVRLLRGDTDGGGMVRAVLSDRYRMIDNLDVLLAVLSGVQGAGTDIVVDGADLTQTKMQVRIAAPGVATLAPLLLDGYRSPFNHGAERAGDGGNPGWQLEAGRRAAAAHGAGYPAGQEPVIFAGFQVSNSDTGHGSFSIVPRLVVQVCTNGLTVTADALRQIHLGGRLDEGVIKWSDDTNAKNLALVAARARDAVTTFLDPAYVAKTVTALQEQAGAPVKDAAKTVELVAKRFAYTDGQAATILDHFIMGGQLTAGGVMQAVASAAATLDSGDQAASLEASAVEAMLFVAAQ